MNREPLALQDLFNHVIANRANSQEIQALIDYLTEQKQRVEMQEDFNSRAFKLANRSTYGVAVMTEQDKAMLNQYSLLCDKLNNLPHEEIDGEVVVHSSATAEYYQTMKQCDRIVWYFSKKGLNVERLLENQND